MYIYLDKQGVVKEIINDEALRQSASNVNEIYVYYEGLQEADIGSVLATYGLPDGTITDEMEVATRTEESEIPYNAERDLKFFQYYKEYPFYHFAIADLALSQEGVVRLMLRLAQKDGEYIKVVGLICFDVEGELIKEDHGVSLAQYNYLVKAWVDTKGFLPLDGSKAMQGNLDMGAHNVILNGKTLKDNNGALNYNGSDLAKQSDTSSLQSQIDTINATQNVVDIVGTKAELNAYATNDLHANDKIEVLADESQSNANTIYGWNGNAWSLVGSKAPYYSKAESDARYNELKAKSYDKDTTEYATGHVPDSGLVKKSLDGISENLETTKIEVRANKTNIENLSAVIPTDINIDSNYNLILEHDGTEITGQKKLVKLPFVYAQDKFDLKSVLFSHYDNKPIIGNLRLWESSMDNSSYESSISCSLCWTTSKGNAVPKYTVTVKNGDITVHVGSKDYSFYEIIYSPQNIPDYGEVYIRVPTKSGTFALLEDLATKQDKRFVHTVEIHYASNGSYFCFTGTSDKNTPIDSVEKLTTVLANRDFGGVGIFGSAGLSKIHVGTSVNDTTFKKYMNNGEYTNPSEETFATVFNPTGFTITDVVTPL